ncbi:YIP1 family protein [Candidatus Chloroploca sp. Khr17]|uniref:YIP1 family protein n=1 Tax=Candidatus Chloroploca sp. Khr17 TaxID=2496869 RepID=UPI00101B7A32|nr:YIP1 family protein [Candidatus Chloroploca sp. Khr17]
MLNTMLRGSWAVVVRPAVANFEEHERNAFGWALLYVMFGATITATLGWLAFLVQRPFLERQYATLFAELAKIEALTGQDLAFEQLFAPADPGIPIVSNILVTLIGFLTYLGIVFLLGRALGGTGRLGELAYDLALFWVPVSVVSALINVFSIGFFSCLTAPVAVGVTYYGLYLTYLSVQAGMNLSARKALTLVLIPALLWLVAFCSLALLILAFAGQM